jgi:uncharacterized protein
LTSPRTAELRSKIADRLGARVARFGRVLRAAGLKLGPGQIVDGLSALEAVEVTRRDEFYWALHAAWVKRAEDRETFRDAFGLFWRDPDRPVNRVLEELLALSRFTPDRPRPRTRRRVLEAMERESGRRREQTSEPETVRLAHSSVEVLRERDFEQMSSAELREAEAAIDRMRLPVQSLKTRRWRAAIGSQSVDLRRTIRATLRTGGAYIPLQWRRRRERPPALVVLCDISGSMAGYTRMLLRFVHALTGTWDRVHTFLFGTRLTNATRYLRYRDPDEALSDLGVRVRDWDGGTRIGPSVRSFNLHWARRVLSQGAVVLLISDGLDRDEPELLAREMARLRRSARRVIWLNPLLRYREFEPEARGIRAMLPHVDEFRPVHNLLSLESLASALSGRSGKPV